MVIEESPAIPPAASGPLGDLILLVGQLVAAVTRSMGATKRKKALLAASTFQEYLHRLDLRFLALLESEHRCCLENQPEPNAMLDLQLDLVDKTEAFHQGVYSTLSALLLLLSHVGDRKTVKDMPIRSVQKALTFLERQLDSTQFREAISHLRASALFRAQVVDHPQQHALRNWLTINCGVQTAVLFFRPDYSLSRIDNETRTRRLLERRTRESGITFPWHPDFLPPESDTDYCLAPPARQTHAGLRILVRSILDSWCAESVRALDLDPQARYAPRTLAEIIQAHSDIVAESTDLSLTARQFPSRISVTYSGDSRPLQDDTRSLIQAWSRSILQRTDAVDLFEREYCFLEEGSPHWLPVQSSIVEELSDLSPSEPILVFAIWIGTVGSHNARRCVFLVNSWQSRPDLRPNEQG